VLVVGYPLVARFESWLILSNKVLAQCDPYDEGRGGQLRHKMKL
jgi:hypothetical protein